MSMLDVDWAALHGEAGAGRIAVDRVGCPSR
jgi:hypothetical protein